MFGNSVFEIAAQCFFCDDSMSYHTFVSSEKMVYVRLFYELNKCQMIFK